MKKILMILICLALAMGAVAAETAVPGDAQGYDGFAPAEKLGMDLLSMMHVSGENTMFSPQSLALALGMAAEGANGETLDEILTALGVQDVSEIAAALPEGLKSANAAFTAPGLVLKQDYIDRLNAAYGAEWFEIDGEVMEKVNAWVQENTDGLIDSMLDEAPGADMGMLLLNAVAMDAKWGSPFVPEATFEDSFYNLDGEMRVEMMHQTEYFDYVEKDGMQIVRLPYQTGNLEMWIALPPEGAMFYLLEILAEEGLDYLKRDVQRREVILSLPKVDVSDENSLAEGLKLLGIETAFDAQADFSGMGDVKMCIEDVLQKVRLQIDEEGTKAAAATMVIMRMMAMLPDQPPVEMNVNRPFAFVIADSQTGSVCFVGAIENPIAD